VGGLAECGEFVRRLVGVLAWAGGHGIPGANDRLQDMANLYAHLTAEEVEIEGAPV